MFLKKAQVFKHYPKPYINQVQIKFKNNYSFEVFKFSFNHNKCNIMYIVHFEDEKFNFLLFKLSK